MDNLVKELNELLLEKELILATAESCSGGMLSSAIISQDGASKIFDRGFVTYSDKSKIEMLNISQNIIDIYGAVSPQCAENMVIGALENSGANIAISITGIAGANGGSAEKPVGLVYIGFGFIWKEPMVTKLNLSGSRQKIREESCKAALKLLLNAI